jgi:hypothetical protein
LATLWSLHTNPGALAALPSGIQVGIKQLFKGFPTVDQVIQPGALRQSILSSGLFHEASLAALAGDRGRAPPPPDLKSALLSLATQLRAHASVPGSGAAASPGVTRVPAGSAAAVTAPQSGSATLPTSGAGTTPGQGFPLISNPSHAAGLAGRLQAGERRTASPEQVARPASGPVRTTGGSAATTGPLSLAQPTTARDLPPPLPGSVPLAQGRADLQISALSQPVLLELLRAQTEKAVARLSLHQWSSSESTESGNARWLLEMPVRSQDGIDIVHFSIDREGGQDGEDAEPAWRVELAFELPDLGPIHARLIVSGNRVSANLWVDDARTVERARAELWRLQEALEKRLLQVTHIGCTAGHPPRPQQSERTPAFVDDRA